MISYTLTQADIDLFTENNLQITRNNNVLQAGAVISSSNVIVFKTISYVSNITSIGWVFTTNGANRATTNFTVSSDKKSASNTMDTAATRQYLEFVIVMTDNKFFTVGKSDLDDCALKHYDIYINDVKAGLGVAVYNGDTVALKTTGDYLFDGNQYIGRKNASGSIFNILFTNTSSTVVTKTNVQSGGARFTYEGMIVNTYTVATPVFVFDQNIIDYLATNKTKAYINNVLAVSSSQVMEGDSVRLETIDNYILNSASFTVNSLLDEFEIVDNVGFYQVATDDLLSDLTVETEAPPVPPLHIITQDDLDVFNNSSAELFIGGVKAVVGTALHYGKLIQVNALNGTVFRAESVGLKTSYWRYFFDLSENDTVATRTINKPTLVETVEFFFCETFQPRPPLVKGYNNVYKLTDVELKDITLARFEGGSIANPIDYGKYILGLISLPFPLDESYILESESIILGDAVFNATGTLLATDTIIYNLGSISIVGEYQDFRDYKNVETILHLPYAEKISIPPEYVINETIKITYTVNLYDGVTLITVSSSKVNDHTVISDSTDLNISIPFSIGENIPERNKPSNIRLGGDNGIYKAFIEVIQNEFINADNELDAYIKDFGTLADFKGFCTVENIKFTGIINQAESEMILSILRNGVIIK